MSQALILALVGAECTGKTTLAQALAARIRAETGLTTAWVPEGLRQWCDREGRTPRVEEQQAIAQAQQARIDAAALVNEVVVCDTTPLMTAVYSQFFFGDDSLLPWALAMQKRCDLSLLTVADLPWIADGIQRDGPLARDSVDQRLRELLIANGLHFAAIAGSGEARLASAMDAIASLLRLRCAPGSGLFTRLARRDADQPAWPWHCERCDSPACEHAVLSETRLGAGTRPPRTDR
jgi:nicotinamide riboside kinase